MGLDVGKVKVLGTLLRCCFSALVVLLLVGRVSLAAPIKADVQEENLSFPYGDARYPVVKLENDAAARRINAVLKGEVDAFCRQMQQDRRRNGKAMGKMSYRVTCNKANVFSCILEEARNMKGKNSGTVQQKAYIFKLKSGHQATYDDVWAIAVAAGKEELYDEQGLVEKLYRQTERAGVALDFQGLAYPPTNLYMDSKLRFHMLLQPGEVTDASAGAIDIDIDEEDW